MIISRPIWLKQAIIIVPHLILTPNSLSSLSLMARTSTFINDRLHLACSKTGKKDRQRIRTLVYLSYMMAFFTFREQQLSKRDIVSHLLLNPPTVIVDRLYERFVGENVKWTPIKKDRMLCYMFLLSLIIDQYSTDPVVLAQDLSVKPMKQVLLTLSWFCCMAFLY